MFQQKCRRKKKTDFASIGIKPLTDENYDYFVAAVLLLMVFLMGRLVVSYDILFRILWGPGGESP